MAPPKIRYEIDLVERASGSARRPSTMAPSSIETRCLRLADRDALAELLLDAYAGTIDYEGETLVEAVEEIDGWFADAPLLDHSHGAIVDGRLAAAVLVMTVEGEPFVAIVMTAAADKGAGLGRAVVEAALRGLGQAGHRRVALYITEGNTPSERLFAAAGACAVADGGRSERS